MYRNTVPYLSTTYVLRTRASEELIICIVPTTYLLNLLNSTSDPVNISYKQCCGSGSGIRCIFYPWTRIRYLGSGIGLFRIPDLGYQTPIF
jgi:hypothetical protein